MYFAGFDSFHFIYTKLLTSVKSSHFLHYITDITKPLPISPMTSIPVHKHTALNIFNFSRITPMVWKAQLGAAVKWLRLPGQSAQ